MASGNLSSVIYDAPHRTGASIVTARRGEARSRRSMNSSRSTYVRASRPPRDTWITTDLDPAGENRGNESESDGGSVECNLKIGLDSHFCISMISESGQFERKESRL